MSPCKALFLAAGHDYIHCAELRQQRIAITLQRDDVTAIRLCESLATAGMRAAPGAIERVQISDGDLPLHTIGPPPPVGICGSGILDAMAEMLHAKLLNSRGVLNKDHPRVRVRDNKMEFVLAPATLSGHGHGHDVTITRSDVNEIQLAKSAIRVGIDVLHD